MYRPYQTETDGSFDFRAVPSGHYRLFAVLEALNLEYANPIAIRSFMDSAKQINIVGKSELTERIDLPTGSEPKVDK